MNRKIVFPRSLQYLIAIADCGSYTQAAATLYVSQPSLSQQIKQLEDSLQTTLLDRSGRTVKLTEAGKIYIEYARRSLNEIGAGTRAIGNVEDLSGGSLRLGWTPITDHMTCCLLEKFNHYYPGISLTTLEMPQHDIKEAVIEGRIDIGIAFTQPFSNMQQVHEVEAKILFEETLCLAVGKAHPLAGQKEWLNLKQLGQQPLALLNTAFALRNQLDLYSLEHDLLLNISVETNSLNVIIELVQFGSLATVLPLSIIQSQCGLYPIMIKPAMPTKAVALIYRKTGYISPACSAFKAMALEWSTRRLEETPMRRMRPCLLSEETSPHEYRKRTRTEKMPHTKTTETAKKETNVSK